MGTEYEYVPVNLKTGEHRSDEYLAKNPQGLVPMLEFSDGTRLTQTLAILDYMDGQFEGPKLLPRDPVERAQVIAAGSVIASDTAPIQNLRVLKYIRAEHNQDDAGVKAWAAHWIADGLSKVEDMLGTPGWAFINDHDPGYFESILIPQIYNGVRWGVDIDQFARVSAINAKCQAMAAFQAALPEIQPDAG